MYLNESGSQIAHHEPQSDEGWWAAVMADEEVFQAANRETTARSNGPMPLLDVDWDFVEEMFERDEVLRVTVHGFNRGGLLVKGESVQGFVPVSHLVDMPSNATDDQRRHILAGYVGKVIRVKVIECEACQDRIVLSERAALSGEGTRKTVFQTLKVGERVPGTVTNVTDFGAFIDLGGVEGLIHVSELSWGRVQHPSDVVRVGDAVTVLVMQISEENARIALSLKRLNENPWDDLGKRYKIGDEVSAQITSIMRFGVFARLEEGVEGLVHISSMDLPPDKRDLRFVFKVGQKIMTRILHIDTERRRLGLGFVRTE